MRLAIHCTDVYGIFKYPKKSYQQPKSYHTYLKVSKSQKQFSSKLHCPKNERNIWAIQFLENMFLRSSGL